MCVQWCYRASPQSCIETPVVASLSCSVVLLTLLHFVQTWSDAQAPACLNSLLSICVMEIGALDLQSPVWSFHISALWHEAAVRECKALHQAEFRLYGKVQLE